MAIANNLKGPSLYMKMTQSLLKIVSYIFLQLQLYAVIQLYQKIRCTTFHEKY